MSTIEGVVFFSDKIYKSRAAVSPKVLHYEEKGERPYIKYACPVCAELGLPHRVNPGEEVCPCCNVFLYWGEDA